LVERVIKRLKGWLSLKNRQLTPYNTESVETHFNRLEEDLDVVISLDTLDLLAKGKRLETIPKKEAKGFLNRIMTDVTKTPEVDKPKDLAANERDWPHQIREFKAELASIIPQLETEMAKITRESDKEMLSTVNVNTRGANLVESGHIARIFVGRDASDPLCWLVEFYCWGSMRQLAYLGGLRLKSGADIQAYTCACTNGYVNWGSL
jgi:hypothetical protein